ncbi:hypothetical protein [Ktedonospora formicarum]|uniref:Uncharacterized protein n=1 Tax=Ktedonospora formicarum TaxID=2778364 RepID=A0A8J3HSR1_9CHLR|nr:hypothetical protein [Ktedonospora formicarum]GHO43277.1 hypothetical protein KSX_14400 [Ktedonospora formicarum]
MLSTCPYCSLANFEQTTTCTHCGAQLQNASQSKVTGSFTKIARYTAIPQTPIPSMLSAPGEESPLSLPISESLPAIPTSITQSEPDQTQEAHSQDLHSYGTTVAHRSWFLHGHRTQAPTVYAVLEEETRHRKLEEVEVTRAQEQYVLLHRKAATVFLSATSIGNHLYMSRTTTVRLPMSMLRGLVFTLLTLFLGAALLSFPTLLAQLQHAPLFAFTSSSSQGNNASSDWYVTGLVSLIGLILFFPALFLFLAILYRSVYAWIHRGDPLHLLRTRHLQPFQCDEIALLEHLADDILRSTARHLGLDPSQIQSTTTSHQAVAAML